MKMKYKIGDIVEYSYQGILKVGTITYINHGLFYAYPYTIDKGYSYCESKEFKEKERLSYDAYIIRLYQKKEEAKELNSYNQIIRKIDNLLLGGEKVLEEIYFDDEKVYSIDKIAVHQEGGDIKLHYTIIFDINKEIESPYSQAIYKYLEAKYKDSCDRKQAEEKTKLLKDFELYINNIE